MKKLLTLFCLVTICVITNRPLLFAQAWKLAGNNLAGTEILGSKNNFDVNVVSHNITRLTIAAGGSIALNGNTLLLRNATNGDHGLKYDATVDGPYLFGFNGGALGTIGLPNSLTWDYNGNVGILSQLVIDNAGANNGTFGQCLIFGPASGEGIGSDRIGSSNPNGLDFFTAFNSRMSIANGGNVGIGTASPAFKLDVTGSINMGHDSSLRSGGVKILTAGLGSVNTFVGYAAGASTIFLNNYQGSGNTFTGWEAGFANTYGILNSYFGDATGLLASGSRNTFIGAGAGEYIFNGSFNCAVGTDAQHQTDGSYNCSFGDSAGWGCGGSYNTYIGRLAGAPQIANLTNSAAFGNGANVCSSNMIVFGNSAVTKYGFGMCPNNNSIIQFANTTARLSNGGTWVNASDRKLKDGFEKLDAQQVLIKINQLDLERWHYKSDLEPVTHIGPIAQDFYEQFKTGDDTTISTIDPAGVALIGIQALSSQNQELKNENEELRSRLDKMEALLNQMDQSLSQCCSNYSGSKSETTLSGIADAMRLDQNVPNPADGSTTISYYIPARISQATIQVSDLSGKIVKSFALYTGLGTVTIQANELPAGSYVYSLMVNDKMIASHKMEITK